MRRSSKRRSWRRSFAAPGEIGVILTTLKDEPFTVLRGMRIAQLILSPVARARFMPADSLPPTDRGAGGFGHTGTSA